VSLSLCVFLRFFFVVAISFSLHAMLPFLANKDEYIHEREISTPPKGPVKEPYFFTFTFIVSF